MKTKTLIKLLQEADPSGEEECCVGNADIVDVMSLPAYYDGCQQVLQLDEDGRAISGKYVSQGRKIEIYCSPFANILLDQQDFPIEYDDYSRRYETRIEERRQKYRQMERDIDKEHFVEYMVKRLAEQHSEDFGYDEVKQVAAEFHDANLSPKDPMPEDIRHAKTMETNPRNGENYVMGLSWHERRCKQWDREIEAGLNEHGKLELRRNLENH